EGSAGRGEADQVTCPPALPRGPFAFGSRDVFCLERFFLGWIDLKSCLPVVAAKGVTLPCRHLSLDPNSPSIPPRREARCMPPSRQLPTDGLRSPGATKMTTPCACFMRMARRTALNDRSTSAA